MKIGDKIKSWNDNEYTVLRLGISKCVCLADDVNVYTDGTTPVEDIYNITEAEFNSISGGCEYTALNGDPLFPDETYAYGDEFSFVYNDVGHRAMLCQVDTARCCLVGLGNSHKGNRWHEPVYVNDPYKVTKEELQRMAPTMVVLKKVNINA